MSGVALLYGLETYDLKAIPYMGDSMHYEGKISGENFQGYGYCNGGEWLRSVRRSKKSLPLSGVEPPRGRGGPAPALMGGVAPPNIFP